MDIEVSDVDRAKFAAVKSAVDLIQDEMTIGIGTGTTAEVFIQYLGNRIRKKNLTIKAVPTSVRTEQLARSVGIDVYDIDDLETIDICVDGADEILTCEYILKGGGGALLREKIVATAAKTVVIIADNSKLVKSFGRFPIPIEVTPFGCMKSRQAIHESLKEESIDYKSLDLRKSGDLPYVTDEGNYILDLHINEIKDISSVEFLLESPAGVVEHGLFVDIVDEIHVGFSNGHVLVRNCIRQEFEHKTVELKDIDHFLEEVTT